MEIQGIYHCGLTGQFLLSRAIGGRGPIPLLRPDGGPPSNPNHRLRLLLLFVNIYPILIISGKKLLATEEKLLNPSSWAIVKEDKIDII